METTKKDFVSFCGNLFLENVKSECIFGSLILKNLKEKQKNQLENINRFYIRFQLKFVSRQNWLKNHTHDPHWHCIKKLK